MNESEMKNCIDTFIDSYNLFDTDALSLLLHQNFEFKTISCGEMTNVTIGIEEFRQVSMNSGTQYLHRNVCVRTLSFDNNKATAYCTLTAAVSLGVEHGVEKTENITLNLVFVFSFFEGKILFLTEIS